MKKPGDIKAENERSLNTLQRAITLAQGRFSLILVYVTTFIYIKHA